MALADDIFYAADPCAWAKEVLGLSLDPWQKDFLRSRSKRIILNCSRQSGKSTICACLGLHESVYRTPSFGMIIAPSQDQSAELMYKFNELRAGVELPSDFLDSNTKLSVRFRNGNRFLCRPGSERAARSFSAVTLLLEDEASRVLDATYSATRPMLAVSGGRHVLLSTPFGKRGHFFQIWNDQLDLWESYEIAVEMCPRISKEFIEEEKLLNPLFEQEYHNSFLEDENSLFRYDDIIKNTDNDIPVMEFV